MNDREWMEAKAHKMIASETKDQKINPYPCELFGEGMIQAFYALGLLTDEELARHTSALNDAVSDRLIARLEEQITARHERVAIRAEQAA